MKRLFIFLIVFIAFILFADTIYIHKVEAKIPQQLFDYIGSRSNMIYYLELFNDGKEKGYLVTGWYFTPTKPVKNTQIIVEYDNIKIQYLVTNEIEKVYSTIPLHLIICPSEAVISIGNLKIPSRKFTVIDIPFPKTTEIGLETFTILDNKVIIKDEFTPEENVLIRISAGLKKTGGFSIEIEDVIISEKEILINGKLIEPEKGEPVTQVFTNPAIQINIGKLKKGIYTITANFENLGTFTKTITVK
ncbi:protease complex subunit PrcB family protein [Thermosipho atlanticus]|uniref:PrcB C-terminal n=1 Tax=Thermosipho atlanticus DSM 15807 TaxID=1123380 RepID=A0A1M5U5L4_9BACT|nr:protease complex subunit PrcB family protein [Thermosipho atlanticus]SHH58322.1 PrcB C-terminal [Thermosipho atlanticus DSM 15807]